MGSIKKQINLAFAVVLLSLSTLVNATVYNIDHTVGSFGSVTGTIETDGTIGALAVANIVDWNLSLNADSNLTTFGSLLGPNSGGNSTISFAGDAFATFADGSLKFDFSGAQQGSQLFQIRTQDLSVVWQMQAGGPFQDELVREGAQGVDFIQAFAFRGPVSLTLGVAAPVPEPETYLLMLVGVLLMLGGLKLNKREKQHLSYA